MGESLVSFLFLGGEGSTLLSSSLVPNHMFVYHTKTTNFPKRHQRASSGQKVWLRRVLGKNLLLEVLGDAVLSPLKKNSGFETIMPMRIGNKTVDWILLSPTMLIAPDLRPSAKLCMCGRRSFPYGTKGSQRKIGHHNRNPRQPLAEFLNESHAEKTPTMLGAKGHHIGDKSCAD